MFLNHIFPRKLYIFTCMVHIQTQYLIKVFLKIINKLKYVVNCFRQKANGIRIKR